MGARIALITVGVCVALILAEALLSLRPPAVAGMWFLSSASRALDPDLIYVNPRHTRASFYRVDAARPTLLTLGDSFTEGFPVRPARSYPADLRRKLERRGYPVNVINLGTGDSGPDQQLRLFRRYALEHVRPDVVVWQFYENDVWDNVLKPVYGIGPRGLEPIPAAGNWLYRRQVFFDLTPLPRFLKLHSRIYGYLLKSAEHWAVSQVPAAYATRPRIWAMEKIRLEIAAMEELAKTHGFRTYYALVPPQALYVRPADTADMKTKDGVDASYLELRSIVASMPGYIDIDFGAGRAAPACTRFYVGARRDKSGFGNRHLNEAGYRFVARRVARRVLTGAGSAHALVSSRAAPFFVDVSPSTSPPRRSWRGRVVRTG